MQRNLVDILHPRILSKLWINVKEHGHIHFLVRGQLLFFETKALNLVKVLRCLGWNDRVCRDSYNVFICRIVCLCRNESAYKKYLEKREGRFTWNHSDTRHFRHKLPFHLFRER